MSLESNEIYEFGPFQVRASEHVLLHRGEPVPLTPKAFDTLLVLVRHGGELLEKERLLKEIWPDTFVEEGNLAQNVFTLRKILGQSGDGGPYIATIPRRGYRFVAPVTRRSETRRSEPGNAIRRPQWLKYTLAVALLAVTAAGGEFLWRRLSKPVIGSPHILRLNVANEVVYGAISPDGKYLAYVAIEPAGEYPGESIWIRSVDGVGQGTRAVEPSRFKIWGLVFSPVANDLYYVRQDSAPARGVLFRTAILGGKSQKILDGINANPSFSPDGSSMVFKRYDPGRAVLIRATAAGTDPRIIAVSQSNDPFDSYQWSKDGSRILWIERARGATGARWSVAAISSKGGKVTFGPPQESLLTYAQWTAKRGMFATVEDESGLHQIWHMRGATDSHRITNDSNDYGQFSLTTDNREMLTWQIENQGTIWIAPAVDRPAKSPAADRQVQFGPISSRYGTPMWTPDRKLVYVAASGGAKVDLWIASSDGTGSRLLTNAPGQNFEPSIPADGQFVVFVSADRGVVNLWRVEIDGTGVKRLTQGGLNLHPCVSPDGKWVAYASKVNGTWGVWKAPAGGGPPVKIADSVETSPRISSDGTLLAYQNGSGQAVVREFVSGALVARLPLPPISDNLGWSRTGNELTFVQYSAKNGNNTAQIWEQPLDGRAPVRLRQVPADTSFIDWSWDGTQMVYMRLHLKSDLVLISGLTP